MGLDAGNSLATVALIVSLIALLTGFLTATQQFLGTAQGYRNCKDSIIGPWSATRHRKWIWREVNSLSFSLSFMDVRANTAVMS
jgi:hypothetical protein